MSQFLISNNHDYQSSSSLSFPFFSKFEKFESETPHRIQYESEIYQQIGILNIEAGLGTRIKTIVQAVPMGFSPRNWDVAKGLLKSAFGHEVLDQKVVYSKEVSLGNLDDKYHKLITKFKGDNISLIAPHPLSRPEQITTAGLSLVVDHFRKKLNTDNLFVCSDLTALKDKLQEIEKSPEDQRVALIVTGHQYEINPDKNANVEQHRMAVCVEKKDGHVKIAVLEPNPHMDVDADRINLKPGRFLPHDLVFTYIKKAKLNPNTTTYYFSKVVRQYGRQGGCGTFAMRDAVKFLKNPSFFDDLKLGKNFQFSWGNLYNIELLPLTFLKATQSYKQIESYANQLNQSEKDLFLRKLEKHKVKDNTGYCMNMLIDDHTRKYRHVLLDRLENDSAMRINAVILNGLI